MHTCVVQAVSFTSVRTDSRLQVFSERRNKLYQWYKKYENRHGIDNAKYDVEMKAGHSPKLIYNYTIYFSDISLAPSDSGCPRHVNAFVKLLG